jgi:hypothetical protein
LAYSFVVALSISTNAFALVEVVAWTALVYCSIAIVVLTVVADLCLTVFCWFGAETVFIPYLIFTNALRLVEVMARTALVYGHVRIAIVIHVVADLNLTITTGFGAIALTVALEAPTNAERSVEIMARTALVYSSIAIVIFAVADLCHAVFCWFGAIALTIALEVFAHAVRLVEIMA